MFSLESMSTEFRYRSANESPSATRTCLRLVSACCCAQLACRSALRDRQNNKPKPMAPPTIATISLTLATFLVMYSHHTATPPIPVSDANDRLRT